MKKYLISIPKEIDCKITEIAREKGITNNNEIRDTILSYYTQAGSSISYSNIIKDLEQELDIIKNKLTEGSIHEFKLGELETIKKLEKISSGMKPSSLKAIIGKQFFKNVERNEEDTLYQYISYIGTKQRVAYYHLAKNKK